MEEKLLKKFISFSFGNYISIIIGIITVPITTRMLSPSEYGIYSLTEILINIIVLISFLGMDQGFMRYFYEEKEELRGGLLYNCIFYPVIMLILILSVIFFFKNEVSNFLSGENDNFIFKGIVLGSLVYFFNRFSMLIIRMNQLGKLYSVLNIIIQVLKFIFILLLYKYYFDSYKVILYSNIFSLIIITLIAIIHQRKIWKFYTKSSFDKKEIFFYSVPLSVSVILIWVFQSLDKIMIQNYSTSYQVGIYSVSFKIIALINTIQQGFTMFWTPVAYEKYSKNPENLKFFENIFDYVAIFFFMIGVGVLLSKDIIVLFLGNKYIDSMNIFPMLIFIPIMYTLSEVTVVGLVFRKKTTIIMFLTFIVTLFNGIGNFFLIPKFGAKGAAISTGITYILFFILRTYFSIKFINFKFNLKRAYFTIILIILYSLYLTFTNKIYYTVVLGLLLEFVIVILYFDIVKNIIKKFYNIFR